MPNIKNDKRTRRDFLRQILCALYAFGILHQGLGASSFVNKPSKPNILYITTDQQAAGMTSYEGNQHIKTPNIDRIAQKGVLFKHAYCATPMCMPCRTSAMTGLRSTQTGIRRNYHYPEADLSSANFMGKIFSEAGYDCAMIGKWHIPWAEDKEIHGFETFPANPGKDSNRTKLCIEFLKKKRTKPFLLNASYTTPHGICQWARQKDSGSQTPRPISLDPPLDDCPPLPDNFEIPDMEPGILRVIKAYNPRVFPNQPSEWWRQYRWAYFRLIEQVDSEIGQLIQTLEETDQLDNTVIIFTSDHGDGAGAHRWNQKFIFYEESVRVPFIIAGKNLPKGLVDTEHLIYSNLDLIPTMCEIAQVETPSEMTGKSILPLAKGQYSQPWRDYVVCDTEFYGNGVYLTGRMVRTNRYKYIHYSDGTTQKKPEVQEQLFDLQKDPGEIYSLTDVFNHPENQSILDQHRNILKKWCLENDSDYLKYLHFP